jgi:hypothetical protein
MSPRSRDERTDTSDDHHADRHEDELFRTSRGLYVLVDTSEPATRWIRTDRLVDLTP